MSRARDDRERRKRHRLRARARAAAWENDVDAAIARWRLAALPAWDGEAAARLATFWRDQRPIASIDQPGAIADAPVPFVFGGRPGVGGETILERGTLQIGREHPAALTFEAALRLGGKVDPARGRVRRYDLPMGRPVRVWLDGQEVPAERWWFDGHGGLWIAESDRPKGSVDLPLEVRE